MPIHEKELGKRLRLAREAAGMRQEDVARRLGVSRPTVAQMELGNRAVTGLELDRLAYLYGRDVREFLADDFREESALVALFRAHPSISTQEPLLEPLRQCLALGRELTNLERLLAIDRDLQGLPSYRPPPPAGKWQAIQQGERIAVEERRRLGLGQAPLPNVAEILEGLGVRTAQVRLPEEISGLTLIEEEIGIFVAVNRDHHVLRRRFSFAHEYCHALLDRGRHGRISFTADRDDLLEVRANSFAACFLMPAEGVQEYAQGLGKGRPSRSRAEIFDEEEVVVGRARSIPGSQEIQIYDVAQIAHHFGVSRQSALYRLRNLRLIDATTLDQLRAKDDAGLGREVASFLDLPEPDHEAARNEFRHRFLGLALEAYRRDEITRAKLAELASMIEVAPRDLDQVLTGAGLDEEDDGVDILLPEG